MKSTAAVALACIALVVAAVLTLPPASRADGVTDYDGAYAGSIDCDAMPSAGALHGKFTMNVSNGQAQYNRPIYVGNSSAESGISEIGNGTVTPAGDVSLKGSAGTSGTRSGWSYEAKYTGRVSGNNIRLTGAQEWTLNTGHFHRPCTINASKSS